MISNQVVGLRTFRIVDVATGVVMVAGVDTRAAIAVLRRIDSIFDVSVAVWDPEAEAWRTLTPREQRALWGFRKR